MISISDLQHRMTLQSESRVADDGGGYVLSWVDTAVLWASIEPRYGKERVSSGALNTSITHIITVRYGVPITSSMRLVHGSRLFNIRRVTNDCENNKWQIIEAEEGVAT